MKSAMKKTTRREIRNSFGRYFAILSIIALGVGFFAGLMVTKPAMIEAGSRYMNENELYDLRLLSTLGFEKNAADAFAGNAMVEACEGAVSTDFLAEEDGEERVLTAHTLLEGQNRTVVRAGRLPEAADECVADANAWPASALGQTIRVSGENDDAAKELFAFSEYKIVGLVDSVCYVNYERGPTSLGNGRIEGFVCLLPEGFDTEYDTELFVRFRQDYPIYSDAYEAEVEKWKDWAKPLTEKAAFQRYDGIIKEARKEIDDAKAELSEKTADAQKELSDAEKELANGQAETDDAKMKIADAERQLSDGRMELSRQKEELTEKEEALRTAREQAEAGLLQAQGYPEMEAALIASLSEIEAGEAQLAEGKRQLADAEITLADREQELEDARKELKQAEKELEDGRREYEDGKKELEDAATEAEEKIADAEAELADIGEPEVYVLGRDTNVGYASFQNDSAIVEGIAKVFPIFFFLVAALVCVTTMNRMVEEQRTQIGVLKALGYGEGRIMGKYLYYSGSAAVAGSVIGFAAGSVVFPAVIWEAYRIMYRLGDIALLFDARLAVVSLFAALLCSMGTTFLTCRYELMSVAADLIRPKGPGNGKRILLERFPFIWKRLSFLVKVSFRNVLRYKRRFFMMITGIGGCTALLLTGFGIRDSIAEVAAQQYGEIQIYDIGVTLKEPWSGQDEIPDEILRQGIDSYTAVCEKAMDLTGKDAVKSAGIIIPESPEEMRDYLSLHTENGENVEWPLAGEAVMNTKLADKCGISEGDTVSLRNDDGEKLTVKATALTRNFVYNYVYVSSETWEECNGEKPEYKSLYVNMAEGGDPRLLTEALLNWDAVSAVTVNADSLDRITNMMSSLNYIVLLVILCAGALAFIVIYNLTNINITERIREIATIKVLGFYPMETAAYVFRENGVLTAIGALAGLALGIFMHRFVMYHIDIDMITFDVRILPKSYVFSILLTFVFMLIVDVAMYVKLEQINMAESLKSNE